ncbi:MAG TPA: efflux RND transporter periplasmic adaptor subunit [Syntrophomonadaceae bacterium]|nr:efflux RND transporter periplasmic adaptor subunit [Syntrophomonadaceae bacterium]HPR92657.1 efflux RND transporter periplasmic adaptor subunit [Syntrophomonadaceae bacterium]
MKWNKKNIWRGSVIAALLIGGVMSLGLMNRPSVEVHQVGEENLVSAVEETGVVRASNSSDIYALLSGRIIEVPVKVGQVVEQGQVLITMESIDLQIEMENIRSQMAQASAAANGVREVMVNTRYEIEQAQNDLERKIALYDAGAASAAEVDNAKARLNAAQKMLSQQNTSLESYNAQISSAGSLMNQLVRKDDQLSQVSPVSGMVLDLQVKTNQVAAFGTRLCSVGDPEFMEIRAEIIEDDMRDIKVGQKVVITSPVLEQDYLKGKVKEIYPQAEETASTLGVVQRRVPVIIGLENRGNLKPGYEVRVAIETMRQNNVMVLPAEAIRTLENGDKQVAVVENGRIRFSKIETGISGKYQVEVIKGLKVGDIVVRDASQNIADGQRVRVK